ncbi:MAG: response regulator [Rhizobiales bacterium]|nr:response regulator [Hyphomicrobiales bacterium]
MASQPDTNRLNRQEAKSKTVLLVEDEVLIRIPVAESLRDIGYEVIEAGNADEAIIIVNSGIHVDLVISDVQMPGQMDGRALVKYLTLERPDIPIILASGALIAPNIGDLVLGVRKPYLPSDIATFAKNIIG